MKSLFVSIVLAAGRPRKLNCGLIWGVGLQMRNQDGIFIIISFVKKGSCGLTDGASAHALRCAAFVARSAYWTDRERTSLYLYVSSATRLTSSYAEKGPLLWLSSHDASFGTFPQLVSFRVCVEYVFKHFENRYRGLSVIRLSQDSQIRT